MPNWRNGSASDVGAPPTILLARMPRLKWNGSSANFHRRLPLTEACQAVKENFEKEDSDCFLFLDTRPGYTARKLHHFVDINRGKWIFRNQTFKLLGMLPQRLSQFGQDRVNFVRIPRRHRCGAQLADSSFQGYIVGHSHAYPGQRNLIDAHEG
jgi:hypothetical protein